MQEYDRTSKWLIGHHGDSILRLAGVDDLVAWRPLQAEVVQPRQLPDGLIEARRAGRDEPDLYVLELATYPDARVVEQVLRDAALVYLDRRILPEVLVVFLHPKGNVEAASAADLSSPLGWTQWRSSWRSVRLWTLPAEDLLATGDLGMIPWVPLTRLPGPPEAIIRECRDRIDRQAPPEEHENLLTVLQVLTGLRYNDPKLLTILGGRDAMIESPVLIEFAASERRKGMVSLILHLLRGRFGSLPQEMVSRLQAVEDEEALKALGDLIATCPDLGSFRAKLPS